MTLTKGRLGTIKEGVILFLSECDLDGERWMTVELSLHHVAGLTDAKSGPLCLCENMLRKLLYEQSRIYFVDNNKINTNLCVSALTISLL